MHHFPPQGPGLRTAFRRGVRVAGLGCLLLLGACARSDESSAGAGQSDYAWPIMNRVNGLPPHLPSVETEERRIESRP